VTVSAVTFGSVFLAARLFLFVAMIFSAALFFKSAADSEKTGEDNE
jgi:hypothetical protein